jgi:hypothetical protein
LVEKVIDEATAAVCAEAVGVLRKLHEGTLDYTKQRKQFGQPIAAFQVLQHRMVDMFIQVEQSVSMTYMANIKLEDGDAERAKAISSAKVQIGRACRFVGQSAIQLHGGMGMTNEMAIGHYFKRATMIESLFGSVDHHLARYEGPKACHSARRRRRCARSDLGRNSSIRATTRQPSSLSEGPRCAIGPALSRLYHPRPRGVVRNSDRPAGTYDGRCRAAGIWGPKPVRLCPSA